MSARIGEHTLTFRLSDRFWARIVAAAALSAERPADFARRVLGAHCDELSRIDPLFEPLARRFQEKP